MSTTLSPYHTYRRGVVSVRRALALIAHLVVAVWRIEPTVLLELGVSWVVAAWSVTSLLYGFGRYHPPVADTLATVPSALLGATGVAIVCASLCAIVVRHRDARGYSSLAAAIWLGYLSAAILATDHRLAGGWVYGGMAVAALLPYWRVASDRDL